MWIRNEELKQKLLNEINKSGFPLELEVIEKLQDVTLNIFPNFNFADSEGKPHEIDAFAMMSDEDRAQDWPYGLIGLNLFIECKSSKERPWVFFRGLHDVVTSVFGLIDRLECVTDIEVRSPHLLLAGCNNSDLREHHYKSGIPTARTYFEAFGKDAGKEIYQAITNIWSALDFNRRFFKESSSKIKEDSERRTVLIQGVIVFKGILALAETTEDSFEITEEPHIILRTTDCFTNKSFPFGAERETIIDVIHVAMLRCGSNNVFDRSAQSESRMTPSVRRARPVNRGVRRQKW